MGIRVCTWAEIASQVDTLAVAHHARVMAPHTELPLAIDGQLLTMLEALGSLVIVGAFGPGGALQGYCSWTLGPSLQSKGVLVATQGPWFAKAGDGIAMLRKSIEVLRKRGVTVMFPHRHETSDPRLDKVFARLGATPYSHTWALTLGDKSDV